MSLTDLSKLWNLNKIDSAIVEIRVKAAALDPGRVIQAQIDKIASEVDEKRGHVKKLQREQTDLEVQQKAIDEKLKKIDKELYGGQVVNPREVENLQKEIETLKKRRGDLDVRILELWEEIPPAVSVAEEVEERLAKKRAELKEYQKKVLEYKQQLEKQYAEITAKRPGILKEVPPAMLSRYDQIRKRTDGVAMAQVDLKTRSCMACGTNLPEKLVEGAKEGRLVTCEACHRILYATEGLV